MRRIVFGLLIIFVLSACSQEKTADEMLSTKNVEIPSTIFTSEKNNRVIDEKEMKQSIQTYLDSSEALAKARLPFDESIWEQKKLTKEELNKHNKINKLLTENDENFAHYISHNTLPKGYQQASERISRYITGFNKDAKETNEADIAGEEDLDENSLDEDDAYDKYDFVNDKEQKKIEAFLDKKHIQTIAFDRDKQK